MTVLQLIDCLVDIYVFTEECKEKDIDQVNAYFGEADFAVHRTHSPTEIFIMEDLEDKLRLFIKGRRGKKEALVCPEQGRTL